MARLAHVFLASIDGYVRPVQQNMPISQSIPILRARESHAGLMKMWEWRSPRRTENVARFVLPSLRFFAATLYGGES
jgi:hypothetical protein